MKTLKAGAVALVLAITVMAFSLATPGPVGAWLAYGPITQYPAEGGTWEYGFWNFKVRSYYTVNQCHGSTAFYNGTMARSIDTAGGQQSIAEQPAIQSAGATDAYYYRVC